MAINMTAVAITAIICATLVITAYINNNKKGK